MDNNNENQVAQDGCEHCIGTYCLSGERCRHCGHEAEGQGIKRAAPVGAAEKAEPNVLAIPSAIMNLPCKPGRAIAMYGASKQAYQEGHHDARHAAADLVLERADELKALAAQPAQACSTQVATAEPLDFDKWFDAKSFEWEFKKYGPTDAARILWDAARRGLSPLAAPATAQVASDEKPQALADMEARKDAAYYERNQVVAALAKCFPSGVARTAIEGWSEDWHGCVYIDLPTGQASWHFHDSQARLFDGLPAYTGTWDGHDTPEKYRRLASLAPTGAEGAQQQHPEGDSFKPVYWFSVLVKCARLLNLPDDEPIPSGVLRAVTALTESAAAPADLPEDRLDHIARQYFASEDYQVYVKHAISDAFKEARALLATHQPTTQAEGKPLTRCAAGRDGECSHPQCPQLRDGEPAKSHRHCPLDTDSED